MKDYELAVGIKTPQIIDVVRNALSKIDPRLVDHGERVGYIAKMIYDVVRDPDLDFTKLYTLSVLHDIGAYKTEEIDEMVKFETNKPFEHALFGYVFLKQTTTFKDCAEAILYHHTDYTEVEKSGSSAKDYAEIIFLADRADIVLHTPNANMSCLMELSGTKFNPKYVDALMEAEKRYAFADKILSDAYKKEIPSVIDSLSVSREDVGEYLKLLVYAIDFRSPYTVTHTADTTVMSMETGKLMGLTQSEMDALYAGAFLHDIGKIAIPHQILDKPARLTPQEFEAIKRHISEGEAILRGVVSDEIADIALNHHEKLNGQGYPRGLTAKELTLPQRIVAVSDVLSALSQRRPYKEAYPKERVVLLLTEMKESGHLCPEVVDTVIKNYDSILLSAQRSHDPSKKVYEQMIEEYGEQLAKREDVKG